MCHADSHLHPCGHSGTQWTYCRESRMTGKGTAPPECNDRTWGNSIKSTEHCPLAYCNFKPGSTWYVAFLYNKPRCRAEHLTTGLTPGVHRTCCACGGSQNSEGWCLHERGRWERDSFSGWMNWIDKCEHNCCTNCTRDFQDETISFGPQPAKSTGQKWTKGTSGLKKGSRRNKKASGPEDVPVPSIEADDREPRVVAESTPKRKGKERTQGSKPSSNKRKK